MSDKEIALLGARQVRTDIGETISKRESAKFVKLFKEKGYNEAIDWIRSWKRFKANVTKAQAGKLKAQNHLVYTIRKGWKSPSPANASTLKKGLYEVK